MKASDKIQYDRYLKGETLPHFRTLSGIEMKEFYQRDDRPHEEPPPGDFPFYPGNSSGYVPIPAMDQETTEWIWNPGGE